MTKRTLVVVLGFVAVSVFGLSRGLAAEEVKGFDASQNAVSEDAPSIFEELQGIRRLGCQSQCVKRVIEEQECDPGDVACKTVRNSFLSYLGYFRDYESCMNHCMDERNSHSSYGSDHGSGDDGEMPPPSKDD